MKRKTVAMVLAGLMLMSSLTGCGNAGQDGKGMDAGQSQQESSKEESSAQPQTDGEEADQGQEGDTGAAEADFSEPIAFSVTFVGSEMDYKADDVYKYVAEKFNVDMEFMSLTWDNWGEKQRIWINSGDMPDVLLWDFNFNEYMEYADQGQFKALPEDFEEKYPNLYATTKKSGIYDYIKEAMDGTLYGVPRTTNAFSESKENVDYYAFIYRKDWAKQLGIEVGDVIAYEDFLNLAKEFATKDPGGNGENRTIGFCGDPGSVCTPFMICQNSYYDGFGKDETGKYYAGIMEDSTLEGVKEIWRAYQDGIIDPNFFSNNADDAKNNFMAGQAGMYWQGIIPNALLELYAKFKEANPELDPREAIGVAVLKAPDGKVHGFIADNYWTAAVFNPDMDDVKQERILSMMDYFCTEEGVYLSNLGIEGVDWKKENGEVVAIEQTDENGDSITPAAKYPSIGYFSYMGMCGDGFSYLNPATAKDIRDTCLNVTKLKEEIGLDVKAADLDLKFFSGTEYSMYDVTARDIITEVVIEAKSEEELVSLWNGAMDEIRDKTDRVLEELNASLGN